MTHVNIKKAKMVNALIWASFMIATSLLILDLEGSQKTILLMLHIGGWFAIDNALTPNRLSLKNEWSCIKGKLGI